MNELVSVYITTHNRLDKLKRAIESVKIQTYKEIEIIICDDASNDGTQIYLENLAKCDNRIIYIRSDENKGACYARNLAIKEAKGKFITGLDDDDEFTKERVSLFIDEWDEKYSFLCANFLEVYNDGRIKKYYKGGSVAGLKELLLENIASNQIFTLTERLREINGFDIRARRLQDWDTWIRLSAKFGEFKRLSTASYLMNHDHSISASRVSTSYPFYKALNDLKERNISLYDESSLLYVNYIILLESGHAKISDSLKVSLKLRRVSCLLKYLKKRLCHGK